MREERINILGGGPVGSLFGLMLAQQGYEVNIFEKRGDPRLLKSGEGRSINLALSHRGIRALEHAGIFDEVRQLLIPMNGRMMHDREGNLTYQPYGKKGQAINSISRLKLTQILCEEAEKAGVHYFFDHQCRSVDTDNNMIELHHKGQILHTASDYLFGADGAFSVLRGEYEKSFNYDVDIKQLSYGYKELTMPADQGTFAFEPNNLHIWPRGEFMLIALPNPEKDFTCTLFMSLQGEKSFEKLETEASIKTFFETEFPDVIDKIPDFVSQFQSHPTSRLNTVSCFPWAKNSSMVIGDAAHAIVPFYGQGMNAGFEDCRLLIEMLEEHDFDMDQVLKLFEKNRKQDADAILKLALRNYEEMRDKVANEDFLNRKKLEARLQKAYPDAWLPLYSMVTFSDIAYSECLQMGDLQQEVLDQLDWSVNPEEVNLKTVIDLFSALMQDAQKVYQ